MSLVHQEVFDDGAERQRGKEGQRPHDQRCAHQQADEEAAVARNDRYAEAYYTLGAVLKAARDWKGASAALGRAITIRPDFLPAHQTLAQVWQLAGDEGRARQQFDRAERLRRQAALEQEASVLTAAGAQKLERGEAAASLEAFRRATAVLNSYAPALYQMGRAFDALGRPAAALEAYGRAQQLNPSLAPPRK